MEIRNTTLFFQLLVKAISMFDYESIDPFLKPRDVPQEELDREYDFIIVGGGIAGCVIANRLSEVPDWKVILIEAGGDETPLSLVPLIYPTLQNTELDWNFTTVPQKHACQENNGICSYPRGKALGGTSVINTLLHVRGNPRDFKFLEDEYGAEGWSYEDVLPFYLKTENVTGLNSPYSDYRGYDGLLKVSYSPFQPKLQKDFLKAGKEYGWIEEDYNAEVQDNSVSYSQLNLDVNIRHSAARAYLYPIIDRENLNVIKNSYVVKILIDEKTKRATGVKYERDGRLYSVYARCEVIITAGIVNTPKLLMLSGIGPQKELKKFGIRPILNLPVGQNLQDHVSIKIPFRIKRNATLTTDLWKTTEAIFNYAYGKTGPLSSNGVGTVACDGDASKDPLPTVSYGMEFMKREYYKKQHEEIITMTVNLLHPESKGSVKLASSDPWASALIDPNYLGKKSDYNTFLKGAEKVFEYIQTPTMKKYAPRVYMKDMPKCEGIKGKRVVKCILDKYVYSRVRPVGTTSLGDETNPLTVVNSRLLVHGLKNLRIVGSSVMSVQITGYAYGATYAFAERAVPFILEDCKRIKPPVTQRPTKKPPPKKPATLKPHRPNFQEMASAFHQMVEAALKSKE